MKLRHTVQQEILQYLLFHPESRFGEIKPPSMDNSRFTFHLDQLIKENWVEKSPSGLYSLSQAGKDEANRFDAGSLSPRKQSKVSVVFCCKNSLTEELLFYRRTKEPYFNAMGFPTGKVRLGEGFCDAAERELEEETQLTGKATLLQIVHIRVYDKNSQLLLEDKIMGICQIIDPSGVLASGDEGTFSWHSDSRFPKENLLPETDIVLAILQGKRAEFDHILTTSIY